jgi:hypothetical protein
VNVLVYVVLVLLLAGLIAGIRGTNLRLTGDA